MCSFMSDSNTTALSTRQSRVFGMPVATPGVLVAYAPPGSTTSDRCPVRGDFVVGRSTTCSLPINDDKVSKNHFRITGRDARFTIEDLGSTNGTFLNGRRIIGASPLPDNAVIRVGREVMVFHCNAAPMLEPLPANRYGLNGPFHTATLLQQLSEAAHSNRHVLLTGPSGSGKELAANALAKMLGKADEALEVLAFNAARFTSEDEATATVFGVAPKVFSNVDQRPGLIEQAKGGVLFLDEVHNLPARVQRSLLRTIEDGAFSRIGESRPRPADVHWVLASNEPGPGFGLAHDLLARLRVTTIPPLRERLADIPEIFLSAIIMSLTSNGFDGRGIGALFGGDHFEAMCLDGFVHQNVRGILDVVDRLVSKMITGVQPADAIASVFLERFGDGPVTKRYAKAPSPAPASPRHEPTKPGRPSTIPGGDNSHYEQYKPEIIKAYLACGGNLTATERMLKSAGIRCTRRWIGVFAKKWGLR